MWRGFAHHVKGFCYMKKGKVIEIVAFVAVMVMVVVFFIISRSGFFVSDDWTMGLGIKSINDVFNETFHFVLNVSGRLFATFVQYLFCGFLGGNKLWFDAVNTLFFGALIIISGCLLSEGGIQWKRILLFALVFWFVCPAPDEALFWVAGATVYFWTSTLTLLFIKVFMWSKNKELSLGAEILLFVFSMICASEMISATAVCGAIVLIGIFNWKNLKRNELVLAGGFLLGTLVLLFSPGNFARMDSGADGFMLSRYLKNIFSPSRLLIEITKYKALWAFFVTWCVSMLAKKKETVEWSKKNLFLLLTLFISVVSVSFLYSGYVSSKRSLLFPEILSIILMMSLIVPYFNSKSLNGFLCKSGSAFLVLLFVLFMVDAYHAVGETKRQSRINDELLAEIKDAGGIVAVDVPQSSHRMAFASSFPRWAWKGMAQKMGLDSVHIYPFYCQDKYYEEPLRFAENIYIDKLGLYDSHGLVVIRCQEADLLQGYVCHIDYDRPKKWYKAWLDNFRNYQYRRSVEVGLGIPDCCHGRYCYHVIYMDKENCKGIKHIEIAEEKL